MTNNTPAIYHSSQYNNSNNYNISNFWTTWDLALVENSHNNDTVVIVIITILVAAENVNNNNSLISTISNTCDIQQYINNFLSPNLAQLVLLILFRWNHIFGGASNSAYCYAFLLSTVCLSLDAIWQVHSCGMQLHIASDGGPSPRKDWCIKPTAKKAIAYNLWRRWLKIH